MAVINNVIDAIENILQNNVNKIDTAYDAKGGMEGWFQVELLYELSSQGLTVEREVPVFDNERCDFGISDGQETIYVELKVETDEWTDMDDAYEADKQKIEELQPAPGYAILVTRRTYPGSLDEGDIVDTVASVAGKTPFSIFMYPN